MYFGERNIDKIKKNDEEEFIYFIEEKYQVKY